VHPTYNSAVRDVTGSALYYTAHMYTIQEKIDEDKGNQAGAPPARASVDAGRSSPVARLPSLPLRRGRTAVRAAARPPRRVGAAVPLAAAGPGAAPCTGVAWTSGALVRVECKWRSIRALGVQSRAACHLHVPPIPTFPRAGGKGFALRRHSRAKEHGASHESASPCWVV
jgi:hypothetical protein